MSQDNIIKIRKEPELLITLPTETSYKGLSQSELLARVRILHEALLKTNEYLTKVHRLAIYNWSPGDTGNIMVELSSDNKGFLLDSILRLRGLWDPKINEPKLKPVDKTKIGWIYKVTATDVVECFGVYWKHNDYAFYDETGVLHNVRAAMLENLFTPIIPQESESIRFIKTDGTTGVEQDASGINLRAEVKLNMAPYNDIQVTPTGLFSNAYERSKALFTVQEHEPTEDNLDGGFRIVYLTEKPTHFYDGWLYLIAAKTIYNYNEEDEI